MKKSREEKIQEWAARGAEWCAVRLWTAREEIVKEREFARRMHEISQRDRFEAEASSLLKKENNNMADVLEENGIRPYKLILTYLHKDCDKCEGCGEPPCYFDECDEIETVTETVGLYNFRISGRGNLEGITSNFQLENYDLLKAVDERTGTVLYEFSEDKEE